MRVALVDSGGANIASVRFALQRLGAESELTDDPETIRRADRVILPGVGAASAAMRKLRASGLDRLIPRLRQPVLGVCLGMQLLFEGSEEGDVDCLGIIAGTARRMPLAPGVRIPHMGWNQVNVANSSPLLRGIGDGQYAYFVHSFAMPVNDSTIATSEHGERFAAMAQQGNFMAAQFHPERSARFGARILDNFLSPHIETAA